MSESDADAGGHFARTLKQVERVRRERRRIVHERSPRRYNKRDPAPVMTWTEDELAELEAAARRIVSLQRGR